jgi:glycine cleavage system transcriptional repressor
MVFFMENRVVVAVIGLDQPGVVACVSQVFTKLGCNIREMTQTALQNQFAGIYIVNKPAELTNEALQEELSKATAAKRLRLTVVARDYEQAKAGQSEEAEPFVISVYGEDRNDIVGTFARIFGAQSINIDSLRAFALGENESMQVFEVSIPVSIDTRSLHKVLLERAKAMQLHLTMQHRAIFEAVHRVAIDQ